jgi:hypothetical protein
MKAMVENGAVLELAVAQKETDFGIRYWQARYSFLTGSGTARWHGTTITLHASEEAAESAAVALAREQGWGTAERATQMPRGEA